MPDDIGDIAAGTPEDPEAPVADYGKPQPGPGIAHIYVSDENEEFSIWEFDDGSIFFQGAGRGGIGPGAAEGFWPNTPDVQERMAKAWEAISSYAGGPEVVQLPSLSQVPEEVKQKAQEAHTGEGPNTLLDKIERTGGYAPDEIDPEDYGPGDIGLTPPGTESLP